MKISRDALLTTLNDVIERVRNGDSLEGRLAWSAVLDDYELEAVYRVGNHDGQGGTRTLLADPAVTRFANLGAAFDYYAESQSVPEAAVIAAKIAFHAGAYAALVVIIEGTGDKAKISEDRLALLVREIWGYPIKLTTELDKKTDDASG